MALEGAGHGTGAGGAAAALRLEAISKTFLGTKALDDVGVEIAPGTIHALVGGNGSGKSTLVKILAGVYRADPGGTVILGAERIDADAITPEWSHQHGLRFVHQALGLFGDLTVAENVAAATGFPVTPYGRIRWRQMHRRTQQLLDEFRIDASPKSVLRELRPAHQTMVAVARALSDQDGAAPASVLVLDEPTATLPPEEVDILLAALRGYARAGRTIIYISHRLDEVIELSDNVTVLRDGRHVITRSAEGLDEAQLAEAIVGRPLDRLFPDAGEQAERDAVLEVRDAHGGPLHGLRFRLYRGEILGVAGLQGSGAAELLRYLFGDLHLESGEIAIDGRPVSIGSSHDAVAQGMAYVPGSRDDAAFVDMSVRDNLLAAQIGRFSRYGKVLHRAESRFASDTMKQFRVRAAGEKALMSTLSGGNQQKVVLARWLARSPKVLLLDEPTQGVDIGSRADVYAMVREAADEGASVIVASSDLEELAHLCDRAIVVAGGRVIGEASAPALSGDLLTDLVYADAEAHR